MINSSVFLDYGQAINVQNLQAQVLRTRNQSVVPVQEQTISTNNISQGANGVVASLDKLNTQKKTASSAMSAIEEIKKNLSRTEQDLVHRQALSGVLENEYSVHEQKAAMEQVKADLDELRAQVQHDANEKAIFQAVDSFVTGVLDVYEEIDGGLGYSESMDRLKSVRLSGIASQAQIEKVQSQLAASTYQVGQLASSYESALFTPRGPFDLAQDLYGVGLQLKGLDASSLKVGSVLDSVS